MLEVNTYHPCRSQKTTDKPEERWTVLFFFKNPNLQILIGCWLNK